MTTTTTLLDCRDLQFDEVCAPLSLDLQPGDRRTVLVASDESAERLLQTLTGLRRPLSGERLLFGHDLERLGGLACQALRRRIGIAAEAVGLVSNLTVLENLLLPASYKGGTPQQLQAQAREALKMVGFRDHDTLLPGHLKPLQRRQILLARAHFGAPELIVYVDFLTGLGSRERSLLLEAMFAHLNGHTAAACLFICSDPAHTGRFGDSAVCNLTRGEAP